MINELITRIVSNVGIDEGLATKSVGMILGFLKKEGPEEEVGKLMTALPGAESLIADSTGGGGMMGSLMSGVGSMMGGGVMGLGTQLMGAGLSMGQIQGVTKEVVGFAREHAGEDTLGAIVGAIPGMGQFV